MSPIQRSRLHEHLVVGTWALHEDHRTSFVNHDPVLRLQALQSRCELHVAEDMLALHQHSVHGLQQFALRDLLPALPGESPGDKRRQGLEPARGDGDRALLARLRQHVRLIALALLPLARALAALRGRSTVVAGAGGCGHVLLAGTEHEPVRLEHVLLDDLILAEPQLRVGRGEADERLQGARGHGKPGLLGGVGIVELSVAALEAHAHVDVLLGHLLLGTLAEHGREPPAVPEVLPQEVHGQDLRGCLPIRPRKCLLENLRGLLRFPRVHLLPALEDAGVDLLHAAALTLTGVAVLRLPEHLCRNLAVDLLSGEVPDDVHKIKPRQQGVWKVDVLSQVHGGVKGPVDRVCCGNDAATCVQGHVHAGFCDGHALLLHGLVDCHAIVQTHLVELVNTDEAPVGEDHRTGLKGEVPRAWLPSHRGGETDTAGSATCGADGERRDVHHEPQHLRFPAGGVAHKEHVDVATQVSAVGKVLLRAPDHL
mmetsp:Transcript_31521/g.90453  ORF Transcript_31521/g.90453 Transcript_31521/m.90453 type:complete len:483 (+) Transcript_31521:317-1765(+)